MKKIIVAIIMLAMLVQLGAGMLVSADDASYKLVAHWDFEGADPYADKATEGTADALTAKGNVTVADGIASVPAAGGSYLVASGKEGTDLYSMANKTILAKVKLSDEGKRTGVAGFISKINTFSYGVGVESANYPAISYVYYNATETSTVNSAINSTDAVAMGEYRIFVMSFDYEEVDGKQILVVSQYMSKNEAPKSADDFIVMSSFDMETGASLSTSVKAQTYYSVDGCIANEGDFVLGKRFGQLDTDRKLNVELDDVKVFDGVLTPDQMAAEAPKTTLNPAPAISNETRAYTVGDKFTAFIQADDANYVTVGNGGSWKVVDIDGAMGGKALWCETKATDAKGDGMTVTFTVPADGKYYVWARTSYPNHSANSMFYSVDGEGNLIWDYPDEDDTAACYNTWHYFYMTERVAGTYTDTAKYGEWTIANSDWRHSPKALDLTAGQHTFKLTGREAGMYIDEFIITSYDISEYDPNAFEGNTKTLEVCKFCGTDWKHYISDGFAQNGVDAQTYFVNTLHTDAAAYAMEVELPKDTDADTDTDTEPVETESDTDKETQKQLYTKAPEPEDTDLAEDTEPVADGGCGSVIGASALILTASALALVARKKKKED